MYGIESLDATVQAGVLIGIVLAEAFILYVGYGAIESLLGRRITAMLEGL